MEEMRSWPAVILLLCLYLQLPAQLGLRDSQGLKDTE